ncbi:MAG: nicotinate phosphoribosyltransferase [Desulfuromonadales bacterium]
MSKPRYSALLTDLYELTMLAGYFREGMHETEAVFDLFFRTAPFNGSYAVFAGLQPALQYLEELRFTGEDIDYLDSLKIFQPEFLDFLLDFRFRGKVVAPREGTVVFPNEPLLSVKGTLAEAQVVESALLNLINFQTLAATKAARVQGAAGEGVVLEFGLRRAQGPDGALGEARAVYVGGVRSTSNVEAGQAFGIPVKGTHAHSWIMAFPDELTAFRAYAECFPESCILLADTYDTLKSGIPNAITVAEELRDKGHEIVGVRLDSGDLAYLSKETRRMFDEAGFPEAKIVASSELDEHVIHSIRSEGGCIDIYGVGTKLATCGGEGGGALGGVYKLVRFEDEPKMKVTSDIAKATLPDFKRLLRVVSDSGEFLMDVMCLEDEQPAPGQWVYDPTNPSRHKRLPENITFEDVRETVVEQGKIMLEQESLETMADRSAEQLRRLPEGSLRLINPHIYKVSMSEGLHRLRTRLMDEFEEQMPD